MNTEQQKAVSHRFGPASFWSMFTSPVATLESLRERPAWLVPVLASAIFSMAINLFVVRRVGFARLINAAGHSSVVIDPQAAMQSALAHQNLILVFQATSTFMGSFLTILVIAKTISLVLTLCGQNTTFKHILAAVAHVVALFGDCQAVPVGSHGGSHPGFEYIGSEKPCGYKPGVFPSNEIAGSAAPLVGSGRDHHRNHRPLDHRFDQSVRPVVPARSLAGCHHTLDDLCRRHPSDSHFLVLRH